MQIVLDQKEKTGRRYEGKGNTQLLVYFSKTESGLKGEFRHLFSAEFIEFCSISEFIFKAELMMEELNRPEAPVERRRTWGKDNEKKETFGKIPRLLETPPMGGMKRGKECFLIDVKYRQNCSWQGQIHWMRKNDYIMTFRSVLELLMILEHSLDTE